GNIEILAEFGTPEQKKRWLEPLLEGEIRSCFSMTEPEVAGSDPTLLRTRAVRDGDHWVINGHKWFTSGAIGASVAIVMTVTDPEAQPHLRASMIIVPIDNPGLNIVRPVPVMGHTGGGGHCEIRYEDCRVPQAPPRRRTRRGAQAGHRAPRAGEVRMKFGLQVGFPDWKQLRDVAQASEGLGFHSIYFPDHLVHEGPERQRDDNPAYDPMVQAAVVAEATRRVRIGHLVLCNLFRHPAVTARSLATLDELSGGRLVAGLGSGWTETEFRMTGIAFPDVTTRLRMLDEALTCLRGLWGGEPFSFAGEFYRFPD